MWRLRDQHVDVAILAEVVAQGGPEHSEPTSAVLSAELGKSFPIDGQLHARRTASDLTRLIASHQQILFAADLPKTRSGKILRRLLRDIAERKAL